MNLPDLIASYKSNLQKTHSRITIKNYVSDINHFTSWFANFYSRDFQPDLLTKIVLSEYQNFLESPTTPDAPGYAYKSFKRHLSSLRSFTSYLKTNDLITDNPFDLTPAMVKPDFWRIKDFKNFLFENSSSDLTIKYYVNDLQSFGNWYEESVKNVSAINPPILNADIILEYSRRLQDSLTLSPKTVNRKLSSIRRYAQFLKSQSLDSTSIPKNIPVHSSEVVKLSELAIGAPESTYSRIPPVRLAQRLSKPYFAFEDKAASILSSKIIKSKIRKVVQSGKSPQPQSLDGILGALSGKNIKKEFYAPYDISLSEFPLHKKIIYHARYTRPEWYKKYHTYPFVHYIHFSVLVIAAVGAGIFLYHNTIGSATATDIQARNTLQRTFVFKGKLLDKNNQPINEVTDLRLGLYTSPTASGSALAWQEVQGDIKPETDGTITLIIGNKNTIPDALFENNLPLYLGITVGDENELTPRQEIGVPYANTAENVQGLEPITASNKQSNVLLALDASGTLSIGGEANPVFTATGGEFTLSGNTLLLTTNAGSDGNVVLNPTGNGKIDLQSPLINSQGDIIAEGNLAIHASASANPALLINQTTGAPLIAASSSGELRFMVDSQGTIARGIWAGTPISTEFGGFGASITPATPGEILYSSSTTSYGHLRPGIAGQCLTTNGYAAPLWSSCGFLSELNGVLSPTNSTMDFVLGATSTSSAKFTFINMQSGTPTFKVGQVISISTNGIEANNQDLSIGGGSTKNTLLASSGGNVGINTSSPSRTLDVSGSWGGNVDYYSDGASIPDNTITRSAHALVYDLEKNAGAGALQSKTTYDITGLPNTNGTFAYIYLKVSKASGGDQDQTINLKINGVLIGNSVDTSVSNTSTKHFTLVRSNNSWHLFGDNNSSDDPNYDAADLAEWTAFSGAKPKPGSITSIDTTGALINSTIPYDSRIAGIISTNPKILIGLKTSQTAPLALSGRVPVIVTSINGKIKPGENITTSAVPGVGMKLTQAGATVGKALEAFNPTDADCTMVTSLDNIRWPEDNGTNSAHPCFKVSVASLDSLTRTQLQQYGLAQVDYLYIGKIMALSQLSWSNAEDLISSVQSTTIAAAPLTLDSLDAGLASSIDELNSGTDVVTQGNIVINKLATFSTLAVGKIKAGSILATNIATDKLVASVASVRNLTVSDNLAATKIASPLISTDRLVASEISPKGNKDLTVNLPAQDSALRIKDGDTKEVARIDSSGNASFSGEVTSASVQTTDATISGTLRAGNLIADNIDGLDQKVASITAQITASKPISNAPLPELSDTFAQASVSAKFGTFYEGLLSLGASTFGDLSVMNQLSIGTSFIFTQNSINTLGTDLAIQPLRQGAISFLAGAVRIETDGRLIVNENAVFNKNLAVKGKLLTNVISPLSGGDVTVGLSGNKSQLKVINASGSAVLAVSEKGDVTASGSGTFAKLNLTLVEQAHASGEFTAVASSSAGTALLKANTNELTVINPLVTDKSLIYITPAQNTNNNILYLMRQTANTSDGPIGSFTVGISKSVPQDTLFNWLIVN